MRAVIQRVSRASLSVDGQVYSAIQTGLVVLVGICASDTESEAEALVNKVINLRVFPACDESAGFERSVADIQGALMVVSQFTLYGSVVKGRRPSFVGAAPSNFAAAVFANLIAKFNATGLEIATGKFGANMQVSLMNSGPATFIWESKP